MLNFFIKIYRKRRNELQKLKFYHKHCVMVDRAFVGIGLGFPLLFCFFFLVFFFLFKVVT